MRDTDEVRSQRAWGALRVSPGRLIAIVWTAAAVAGIALPLAVPVPAHPSAVSAIARTFLVVAVVTAILFGPGLAIRFYLRCASSSSLGWTILPGGGLLAATGLAAWGLSHMIAPATTCRVVLGAALLVLLGLSIASLWRRGDLEAGETAAIAIVLLVLMVGLGRNLYSLGPPGELYGGLISRTYEATIIPDSRISFHDVQLIANGASPYGRLATSFFFPYNFSARGPVPGMAAAPIVLIAGTRVPSVLPNEPWQPFDPQGFAAYRIAMEAFAAFALLNVFALMRRFTTTRTALFATVLAATTPFVVHEVYFTWPKLISAGMVLLAAEQLLRRRALRAGLLVGLSYLLHPVGLVAVPGLLLLSGLVFWRDGPRRRLPLIAWSWLRLLVGTLLVVAVWQALNRGHVEQSSFVQYVFEAGPQLQADPQEWIDWRLRTLADTLLPFHQLLTDSSQPYTFPPGAPVRAAVRFGIGYWGTLAFGAGVLFYPVLVFGICKSVLKHPYVTIGCVVIPFAAFVVYWGSVDLGLMLAGLQAWLLGTLAVYAWTRSSSQWWPTWLERIILLARVPEIAFMILFPALWTQRQLLSTTTPATDLVGLSAIAVGLGGLLWFVWRLTDPGARLTTKVGAIAVTSMGASS